MDKIRNMMSIYMKIHVHTERTVLRDWESSDLENYARIASDPDVMAHIGDGKTRPHSYAVGFIDKVLRQQTNRGWTRFAVEHRKTGKLMGYCGLDLIDGLLDFGWRYAKEYWGAGYGYEAANGALYVAQETFGLTHITCQSYIENAGSIRIMQKMGMDQIGESEAYGRPLVVYGFKAEWPNGLQARVNDLSSG